MKTVVFDGKGFAERKKEELKIIVGGLNSRGTIPCLASILIGNDRASVLYVSLKRKAAQKIGAELYPYFLPESTKLEDVLTLIRSLNTDRNVHGVMVQLPIPGKLGEHKSEIINAIDPKKDVDGLKENSFFIHPTSKAVMDILRYAKSQISIPDLNIVCVVGSTGMVGKPLIKELKTEGYKVIECNKKTKKLESKTFQGDIVISATGHPGLIKAGMVKRGVIAIDVGSPKGDFDSKVEEKTSFFTPVPGGVGPVTIVCLLENLIEAC